MFYQYAQRFILSHRKLEKLYYSFRKRYQKKLVGYLQISDILFLAMYLIMTILDGYITLRNIHSHHDESHPFTSFMMEKYGIHEGLLRVQGIEALQLAALLGFSYIIVELWKRYKGERIDIEIRLGLVYVYLAIGISKHIQGLMSWL